MMGPKGFLSQKFWIQRKILVKKIRVEKKLGQKEIHDLVQDIIFFKNFVTFSGSNISCIDIEEMLSLTIVY